MKRYWWAWVVVVVVVQLWPFWAMLYGALDEAK